MIDEFRRKPHSITNREVEVIIDLYQKGEKLSNITDKTRISRHSIYAILKRHGVNTERIKGKNKIPPKIDKRVVTMYKNGYSLGDIMESTLISNKSVYNVLKRNREKIRKELRKETQS